MSAAPSHPCTLALETSSRIGEVALGRDNVLLGTAPIPAPPRGREHRVDLMLVVQQLCQAHNVTPGDIGQVCVSIGPGSFTGLRNGITSAKMLALTRHAQLIAVPTTDVIVRNVPPIHEHVAVCLNTKADTVYAALYRRDDHDVWQPVAAPQTLPVGEILVTAPRPLALLGDHLPPLDDCMDDAITILDKTLAQPRAAVVWQLGRAMAQAGQFTDPLKLLPLYARPPEAVTLWENRKAGKQESRKAGN